MKKMKDQIKKLEVKHGGKIIMEVISILLDDSYATCDDDQCDDEGCILHKAFKKYLEINRRAIPEAPKQERSQLQEGSLKEELYNT